MKNEQGRVSEFIKVSRSIFWRIVPSLIIVLIAIEGSVIGWTFQKQIMEYYIYYTGNYARYSGRQRYEHAFKTREEAEKARQEEALKTPGTGFLAETYIKEVPTGRYETPPPSNTTSPTVRPSVTRNPVSPKPANTDNMDILRRLKRGNEGESSIDGKGEDIRSRLKRGNSTESSVTPGLNNEQDIQEVRVKIAELRTNISTMQTLLRGFSKSLLFNNSELEAWAKTVDRASNDAWKSGKDLLKKLFFYYGMFGLEKSVQKGIFIKLDKLIFSADPNERLRLGREILSRHLEFDRVKKVVDWGLLGDGFMDLLASDDDTLKKSLDALLLVYDLMEATGLSKIKIQNTPLGFHFAIGKNVGEAVLEGSAAAYSWYSINRLNRENDQYAREIGALSYRMKEAEKRIRCLENCLNDYTDGCLDRCEGKTRFTTPPPLLK